MSFGHQPACLSLGNHGGVDTLTFVIAGFCSSYQDGMCCVWPHSHDARRMCRVFQLLYSHTNTCSAGNPRAHRKYVRQWVGGCMLFGCTTCFTLAQNSHLLLLRLGRSLVYAYTLQQTLAVSKYQMIPPVCGRSSSAPVPKFACTDDDEIRKSVELHEAYRVRVGKMEEGHARKRGRVVRKLAVAKAQVTKLVITRSLQC